MKFSHLICLLLSSILLQISAHPQPEQESLEDYDDTQQQQQVDSEVVEEFSKYLPSKGGNVLKQRTRDPCLEPLAVGPCRARVPKFFFNSVEGKCERFYYGGCKGTQNNFDVLTDCDTKCSSHIKRIEALKQGSPDKDALSDICESPPVTEGEDCGAIMPRWTYNVTQEKCVQFIYSGCGATKNNYPNKILCRSMCGAYKRPKEGTDEQKSNTSAVNEICNLSKSAGLCFGIQQKYYYNKEKNRCERFQYGGCGGNDNRFNTPEECIRSCGGDTPANDVQCSHVECSWSLYTHYTSLGCRPIYDGQACCPTRFDCPDQSNTNEVESRGLGAETTPVPPSTPKCMYKGKAYDVGETVDEASDPGSCRASCYCSSLGINPKIMCANIECPENFGAYPSGKEGCLKLYKRGACCAYDFYCPNKTTEDPGKEIEDEALERQQICEFEGKKYYSGERIYPKQSSCLKCVCKSGFNGSLTNEFCEKIDCGIEIYYSDYLAKGCAPVYFHSDEGDRCCPISWECPQEKNSSGGSAPITILPIGDPIVVDEGVTLETPSPPEEKKDDDIITILPIGDPIVVDEPRLPPKKEKWHRRVSASSCQLPKALGDCKGSRPRYYFNNETQECERFTYTGCAGNENNFVGLQDCEKLCVEKPETTTTEVPLTRNGIPMIPNAPRAERSMILTEVDPCTMPMKRGNCRAYFPRFFYSPQDNSCKFFIYGGCRGNHNNFYTIDSCESTCTNKIPVANLRTSLPTDEGDSSKVNFGNEDGETKELTASVTPVEEDLCNLRPEIGLCKAFVRRFYYDPAVKYCKRFFFGGCGGNGNNFLSLSECDIRCSPSKGRGFSRPRVDSFSSTGHTITGESTSGIHQEYDTVSRPPHTAFTERCRLPLKVGPCYANHPSYYYDVSSKTCKPFTYGGCFGNANRFSTFAECQTACIHRVTPEDGNVFARSGIAFPKPQGQPSGFPYEGYQERVFCGLPPEKGDGNHLILRYYWDQGAAKCLPFVYSGSKGNKNNFLTESDCLSMCGNEPTIEQLTSEGILSCSFGNDTYPLGAVVGAPEGQGHRYSSQEPPCGVPICQCLTPPTVTCIQTMCPPPPPLPTTPQTTTTEKICPVPSCGRNCKEATGVDGCPTCDCDPNVPEFDIVQVQLPEPNIKTVKG